MGAARLPRAFYERSAEAVAPDLLGKDLVRVLDGEKLRGRIVETEAYLGASDPASHAFRGKTRRNAVMFGPPGFVYVYFTYGMHYCMNVVTRPLDTAEAVLIRALEPLDGIATMSALRKTDDVANLCSGPAKLCQALHVTMDNNGTDLEGETLWIEQGVSLSHDIATSTRTGVSKAADRELRFYVCHNRYVSPHKPGTFRGTGRRG